MGAENPFWPGMLRRQKAAAYCDLSLAAFESAINDGSLPHPVVIAGQERWLRAQLDASLEALAGERKRDWRANSKLYSTS